MIETIYGYDINVDSLPPLLTQSELNRLTFNKFATDGRACGAIEAASSAIRNYCGWHLAGNVECSVTYTYYDLHVTRNRYALTITLPTRCLTEVKQILLDGVDVTENVIQIKRRGQVDLHCAHCFKKITIVFMSGLVDDKGLKTLVANRVSNALSGTAGVSSESAGGVSISYSSSYVAGANANTLLTADKEYLKPYVIEELL